MANKETPQSGGEDGEESWTIFEVRKQALDLLARRGHSSSELRDKLVEREIPDAMIEEVCDQLEEEGRLDDLDFARHQATILRDRQWGPNQIRRKLTKHGVDEEIVDLVLDQLGGREVWIRGCWERLCDRFGNDPAAFGQREKEKAYRHLTHRGFRPAVVRQILFDGVRPKEDRT